MAARRMVTNLTRACLTKFEENMWQVVPLVDPEGLVALSTKTRLPNGKNKKPESKQLLHKAEQVVLKSCGDNWRYFKHYQVSSRELMHGCRH